MKNNKTKTRRPGAAQHESYDATEHVKELEEQFKAGDLAALPDAMFVCGEMRLPPAEWMRLAVMGLCKEKILKRQGRGRNGNQIAEWRQRQIRFLRWVAVAYFRAEGNTWDRSYELASQELLGTIARGGEKTLKKSYLAEHRRQKEECKRKGIDFDKHRGDVEFLGRFLLPQKHSFLSDDAIINEHLGW